MYGGGDRRRGTWQRGEEGGKGSSGARLLPYLTVELLEALAKAKPTGQGHSVLGPGKDPRNGSQGLHPSALLPPVHTTVVLSGSHSQI